MQDNWLPGEFSSLLLSTEYTVLFLQDSYCIVMATDSVAGRKERSFISFFNTRMYYCNSPAISLYE